jgi:hypothetical protein
MKKTHHQSKPVIDLSKLFIDLIILLVFASLGLAGYFLHGMQTGMPAKECRNVAILAKQHPSLKFELDRLTKKGIIAKGTINETQCEMLLMREALAVNQKKTEGIF